MTHSNGGLGWGGTKQFDRMQWNQRPDETRSLTINCYLCACLCVRAIQPTSLTLASSRGTSLTQLSHPVSTPREQTGSACWVAPWSAETRF